MSRDPRLGLWHHPRAAIVSEAITHTREQFWWRGEPSKALA